MSNKIHIYLFVFLLFYLQNTFATLSINAIKCELKENPIGVGEKPRFSWVTHSDERVQVQTAYHILVADSKEKLNRNIGNIWDSDKVISGQSILVPYTGNELSPAQTYYWKVKIWDKNGLESGWSEAGRFVTGLFNEEDWSGARWIAFEDMEDSLILVPGIHPWGRNVRGIALRRPVVPLFRKEFSTNKEVQSVFLFISGLGHYKAYINGEMVSDDFLSPGWTDYQKAFLYNTYDVTEQIREGKNAIGVIVGNGFHNVNNERYRKLLITYWMPKVIGKLLITYSDGSSQIIVTGSDWKAAPSPITFSSIYGGEDYDARQEQPGWNQPGFNDNDWRQALLASHPGGNPEPEITYPIRVKETFEPIGVTKLGTDTFIYDFGQNASGIIRFSVKGNKGDIIRLIPGELLDDNGYVTQRATGRPYYFEYILKGDGIETWQPLFTYYGFRYVQVVGAQPESLMSGSGKPVMLKLSSLHTYNSTAMVGEFSCSNELFNRINRLVRYAIQSNLQSVVTDCPHREKLGWLEQTHLMGGSIHYNFDLYHLYRKLVDDMMYSQTEDGLIPNITPEYVIFDDGFRDSPEWGSAGIILPWLINKWYGDISLMEKAWPMMVKYLKYLKSRSDGHILSHGLGDWYDIGPERPGFSQLTPVSLTATAIYYYNVQLMAEMSVLLSKHDEQLYFTNLAKKIKKAFNRKFFNDEAKVYSTGSQTSMAMPLVVGLIEEGFRDAILQNLADSVRANNKALTAGDVGFHYLVEALTIGGKSQLFFEMNNRDDVPGYGYQLKKGATALTESWAALENVSNNHLMLGHIMEWFYKGLGGIRQENSSVAYERIIIKPDMVGDLTNVKCSFFSPYGKIKSEWEILENAVIMKVSIPVNATATVYLPARDAEMVSESGMLLQDSEGIQKIINEDDKLKVVIGSGNYSFNVRMN